MSKNEQAMETTFVEEAKEEEQKLTTVKEPGNVKRFIKRHWKTAALVVLSGLAGYGLGKKNATRTDNSTEVEVETSDGYVEEITD